jgi:tetratricopeptide (TPR) repeat protein
MARDDEFTLTPEELRNRKRKRRRLLLIAFLILLVLVGGFFAVRPVRNSVRAWQARRHADRAFTFIEQQKWHEARDEATAAYQLQPNEPQATRAVARLLSRAGQTDALGFWKNLASMTALTREDLRDEARIALKADDIAAAEEATNLLLGKSGGKAAPADFVLAAEVSLRKREFDQAGELAKKALNDSAATRRDQLQATLALDTVARNGGASLVGDARQIEAHLVEIGTGNDDVSLEALVSLAERILNAPADKKNEPPLPPDELIDKIDNHPLATTAHKLLAADLEISQQPAQREQIEQRAIDRWKNGSNEALAALGGWLYRHGQYQRELDAIPLERATQTRELFLQHVDALGALNRWDDIRKILEHERFPLDPVIQNMYLARCYAQQGQQEGADNNWQRAIENAAGDLGKLLMLGDYAEKNGAHQVAATAYEAAVVVSQKSRPAQLGRLRAVLASGDTKKLHAVLVELLKIWPNDTSLKNDEAYARLLLLPPDTKPDSSELKSIELLAEKLVHEEPTSLPHRTLLALALLKENRPYTALTLYQNLTVPQNAVNASTIAVHAAVLAASGQIDPAKSEVEKIPLDKLLPEERSLIANL